jgi:outer membrane protein assembly factor BamE (lipoprotein component of BamABCDE complex)
MNKAIYAVAALLALSALSACSMSQKKTEAAPQVVEFTEAEVPHILVTKKDGKMSAEIVDSSVAKVTIK